MKIVSLLPSATEILAALGLTDVIVARSHECDHPPEIQNRPIATQPKLDPHGTSIEVHDRVTELLQSALSVYRIETDLLEKLQPTHIVTQAQCDVCAVNLSEVEQAVAALMQRQPLAAKTASPQIISLQPNRLADIWADIERVATQTGTDAQPLLTALQSRVQAVTPKTQSLPENDRPTVACLEWIDPLMAAGNWIPELIDLAGGQSLFGIIGQHSPWLQWDALLAADPAIIIAMPCGFNLARTRQEIVTLTQHPHWQQLRAVQTRQVYITDGNAYFNRPGPRLVDSLEILAEILHPEQFSFGYQGTGWQNFPAAH